MFGIDERCRIEYNGKVREVQVKEIRGIYPYGFVICWSFTDNGYRSFKFKKLVKIST